MKTRTLITLLYTLLTASILFVFAIFIYISSAENREKEFYSLLKDEAITKANLFFEAKVEAHILQDIYRSNREVINEVEVAIYTQDFELLYHDAQDLDFVQETAEMITQIIEQGSIEFNQDQWQVVGLAYPYNGITYAITAAAYDEYGYTKLARLRHNLLLLFLVAIIVIYITGLLFSKRAFTPIKKMAEDTKKIHASNLNYRLNVKPKNKNDEIYQLSSTFNEMLDRLENSFDAQKQFVSHISHELRTPLAATITELELALTKEQNPQDYVKTIQNALNDSQKIVKLTNSILDFAKASYDPSQIQYKPQRIDELLIDASHDVKKANPHYQIELNYLEDKSDLEQEDALIINANEYLLKIAFSNLMDNSCKFSHNHHSQVSIATSPEKITLKFSDNGIGIDPKEQEHIFTPFYRGKNQTFAEGNGIGLSLVQKIIHLHKGTIKLKSKPQKGTTFTVQFPTLQ